MLFILKKNKNSKAYTEKTPAAFKFGRIFTEKEKRAFGARKSNIVRPVLNLTPSAFGIMFYI